MEPVHIEDPVVLAARNTFHISYLYPWQRLVIANILDALAAGEHARSCSRPGNISPDAEEELFDEDGCLRGRQIILLPTGAGKSLCFQIPALFAAGPTLVIYPLLALMGDQKRRMDEGGLEPALFRGEQSAEEREAQYRRLEGRDGKPPARLVIANPEVLAGEKVLSRIAAMKPAHIAIDEAHCVSEWGDTFRPSYLELGRIIDRLGAPAVSAFTATASPPVLERIAEVLFGGRAHLVRGEADRPNIRYEAVTCRMKEAALARTVHRSARPLVVFCATRGGTERTARLLRSVLGDQDIRFYHAGLQKEEKIEVEAWFHGHDRAVLCTTCAWGMGVDKKNVRTVIHRDPPPTAEAYIQEAGRGGRDGGQARAVLLWSPSDSARIRRMKDGAAKERAKVLEKAASGAECRRLVLLKALGDPRAGGDGKGGETLVCSGCDVCGGTAAPPGKESEDGQIVLDFIRKNGKAYSAAEAAGMLENEANRASRLKDGIEYWARGYFISALTEFEKEGTLTTYRYWPWKDRIGAVNPRPRRLLLRRPHRNFFSCLLSSVRRRPSPDEDGEVFSGSGRSSSRC